MPAGATSREPDPQVVACIRRDSPGTAPHLRIAMLGADDFEVRPGGLGRYFDDLRGALTAAGHDVRSVTVHEPDTGPRGRATRWVGVVSRCVAYARQAGHAARGRAVVDAHFALYAWLTFRLIGFGRVRIVHFHGPWADESATSQTAGQWAYRVKRWIERDVYRRADHVITLSRSFAAVVGSYGVPQDRITVIPPGVDLKRFDVDGRPEARRHYGISEDQYLFVCARRLEVRMGIDVLLTAFDSVYATDDRARLLIAGTGEHEAAIRQHAERLPCQSAIRLLGRLTDRELASLYLAGDCAVVPSTALEGFGLVTLEALATGTPSIVSDVGGLPEAIQPLDASLVVPAGNPSALAGRMLLAASGDLPPRDRCRSYAERYTWAASAERHRSLYEDLLARRASGA